METNESFAHIKGWGIDADPENEPTYPIKNYTGDDHKRLDWERPQLQVPAVEILFSNERPGLSAIFGTTVPPSGLSGAIRRIAFKFSESSYGHWLPLLFADRVNVLEGLIDDLSSGHLPRLLEEKGMSAELKYNKAKLVEKVAGGAFLLTALTTFLIVRKRKGDRN